MQLRGREFFEGVRLVGAGFRVWKSSPRIMVLGLIPSMITAVLFVGMFAAIAVWADDWARGLVTVTTHDKTPSLVLVSLVAIAIIGGGVLLAIVTFTSITLLIGQPFFEAIADRVAPQAGLVFTDEQESLWRSTLRGIGEGLQLLAFGVGMGCVTFVVGLVPGVGTVVAFVISALVGGHLLALELTAYPLSRVGVLRLRERRRALAARRSVAWGFGVTAYLLFLVPFGAVLSMPALVAGGTLLAARTVPSNSPVVAVTE